MLRIEQPDKSQWLIVHPTANLQRERNTFRAAQLWKVMPVSDVLTLVGTFYSAGITFARPVDESPRMSVEHTDYLEETAAVPDIVMAIYREQMAAGPVERPVDEAPRFE